MAPILPPAETPRRTAEQIGTYSAKVYGLLLTGGKDPLTKLVRHRWDELHHMTGPDFLLLVSQPPAKLSEAFKGYWKAQLGNSFKATWKSWQRKDAGAAYDYLTFCKPPLDLTDVPCLVLFVDAKDRHAVVRSLPSWSEPDLYELMKEIFESVHRAAKQPKKKRLNYLTRTVTSRRARLASQLSRRQREVLNYLDKHPWRAVTAAAGFVGAVSAHSIIPLALGPGALAFLNALKKS